MARKKRAQGAGKSRKGLIGTLTRPWVRRLLLFFILLGLFLLFGIPARLWDLLLRTFGVGVVPLAVLVGLVAWTIWCQKFYLFVRYWNLWLGGMSLAYAGTGFLSLFRPGEGILHQATMGGSLGGGLTSSGILAGILRLGGLVLLGAVLVAPGASARAFRALAGALWWALRRGFTLLRPAAVNAGQSLKKIIPPIPIPPFKQGGVGPAIKATKFRPAIAKGGQDSPDDGASSGQPALVPLLDLEAGTVLSAGGWRLPSLDILDKTPEVEISSADTERKARLLEQALESYGVEAKVVETNVGPTVTQFGVEPGWDHKYKEVKEKDKYGNVVAKLQEVSRTRVKVERITSLGNDLSLALAAPSIRIEAPVPGKSLVGVEVPNASLGMVTLRSVIESTAFQKLKTKSRLALGLGKGAGGEAVACDLAKMPHLLIAGATGSGKTVSLNSMISCLLLHNAPDEVRLILIDPKRVEFISYNTIPHLVTPVIVDPAKAVEALRWLSQEMDARYREFAKVEARHLEAYNKNRQVTKPLPYLVLVIDELADLMMTASEEVERILCRLAQLARATGIHLVVATQRPSVDVVTGLIKANFPARISFAVTSQVDSRTIIDSAGAEKLLGFGDMLYMPPEASKSKRLQGCFISDVEIERLVYFWGRQRKVEEPPLHLDELVVKKESKDLADPLLEEAKRLTAEHKHVSASFLQRRLRIGYPRAARLAELLEEKSSEADMSGESGGNQTEG